MCLLLFVSVAVVIATVAVLITGVRRSDASSVSVAVITGQNGCVRLNAVAVCFRTDVGIGVNHAISSSVAVAVIGIVTAASSRETGKRKQAKENNCSSHFSSVILEALGLSINFFAVILLPLFLYVRSVFIRTRRDAHDDAAILDAFLITLDALFRNSGSD